MAWEWSHTQEAYDSAYDNLSNQSREFLEVTYAEIQALGKQWHNGTYKGHTEPFYSSVYKRNLSSAKRTPTDLLVDAIWEFACNQATCDNGGYNAWVCPYGCHTVSFSKEGEDED